MIAPIAALLIVQILFAALPIASKFVLEHAHPFFVVVLRSAFGALFFFVLTLFFARGQKRTEKISAKTHFELLALAFFGITFNQMALFVALPHTSASIASIVSPTIAIFTLIFSVMGGREKFEPLSVLSICLGTLGVGLVLWSAPAGGLIQGQTQSAGQLWANTLNLVSAASYAFYLAKVGHLPTRIGTFRFIFLLFFYGLILNCFCWTALYYSGQFGFLTESRGFTLFTGVSSLGTPFWSGLAFLLLGATAATYVLNAWALQKVKPSLVGGFVCLQTLFGLVMSSLFLNETLTPFMIFGSVFILAGVLLLSLSAPDKGAQSVSSPEETPSNLIKNSATGDFSAG